MLEKVGIEAQVERIGKYKSVGDQIARKSMSTENREMLTTLLDNIYENWLDKISLAKGAAIAFCFLVLCQNWILITYFFSSTGKKKEDIENFINEGVFQVERMKQEGLITDIKYDDEVLLTFLLRNCKIKNLPDISYVCSISNCYIWFC